MTVAGEETPPVVRPEPQSLIENFFGFPTGISGGDLTEVRLRRDKRGANLISDAPPFFPLWHTKPDEAIGYAQFYSRSHDAVIRVYNVARNVIETHERKGEFKE